MALVGCIEMATHTTGLLQRMLPRLDATHLAVCIAVSKLFETSPENRNHGQAFRCCQPFLPCMTDLVLPRLQTKQQSLSVTFSIKTHKRCISKALQHFIKMLSGALNFAAHMRWDRNGFSRLHSNGCRHDKRLRTQLGCCNGCYQD